MLRYDVKDDSYDRGASGRCNKPFAAFYEDDFRDEVDASRQEQAYTKDRYRERKHVPERKGRVFKDRDSGQQQTENSKKKPLEESSEECQSAEVHTKLQQVMGTNAQTELNTLAEGTPTTNMNYCEYLKRPMLDYDNQQYPQTVTNLKNNATEAKGQQSPSTALVVYSSQNQLEDHDCNDGKSEGEDNIASNNLKASPVFYITPEVMDSLCEQYSREYRKSLLEQAKNVKQDVLEHNEDNSKTDEMKPRDCSRENSDSIPDESKISEHEYDSAEDVCSDKYIQQIFNRYQTQSLGNKQETSPGENDFVTVGSTKHKSYNDSCDANFHTKNPDTPYVVKDYTCKTTKKLMRNDASEHKPEENFEGRQKSFWHSCDPPKGIKKGCHSSSKDRGPCGD
uniref:Fatty acid metabolism regulator protein n=1 Tax=Lygus hesperus TaxID=30085 RepID=A0A0A9XCN7_LYGHE